MKEVLLKCSYCNKEFNRKISQYNYKNKLGYNQYCSNACIGRSKNKQIKIECLNCKKYIHKRKSDLNKNKSGNFFCSRSCSATYNNKHKKHGIRRSKLEIYIESRLTVLYPRLKICYNKSDAIGSELDIYIPDLMLAFELNGIFHYESIFGENKLLQIQSNDNRKFQACLEKNIELCIIDTSSQKYFKPKSSQKFIDIITKIIDLKYCKPSEPL